MTTEERFWEKVNKRGPIPAHRPELGPCWVWTAAKSRGYGRFWLNGRFVKAHRFAFGPIPVGLEPDHLCLNKACVRRSHMEAVTPRAHIIRGGNRAALNARKTHCQHGHPFDPANTYTYPDGRRECRACRVKGS
jgi:hypothetical protein